MTAMNEEKELDTVQENHENDDMIAPESVADEISFKVSEDARPQHTWTRKQIRNVWIAAVVAVLLFILISFLLSLLGIDLSNLGNIALQ